MDSFSELDVSVDHVQPFTLFIQVVNFVALRKRKHGDLFKFLVTDSDYKRLCPAVGPSVMIEIKSVKTRNIAK